ncbi:MAG: zf-HC2 domain-containing protein [Gemmatimonadaceae bacterium]|nr:zf-HC2 domain-containing protein [Gemmatimonadaceae bacterium]
MQNRAECEAVVRRLWPFLDGALPESEKARIIAHLEECSDCSSHFAFAQAFLEAVREAKPPVDEYAALRLRVIGALSAASLSGPTP